MKKAMTLASENSHFKDNKISTSTLNNSMELHHGDENKQSKLS